jgi:hypothetical protein
VLDAFIAPDKSLVILCVVEVKLRVLVGGRHLLQDIAGRHPVAGLLCRAGTIDRGRILIAATCADANRQRGRQRTADKW